MDCILKPTSSSCASPVRERRLRTLIHRCAIGDREAIAETVRRPIFVVYGRWAPFTGYVTAIMETSAAWNCCGRDPVARDKALDEVIDRFSQVPEGDQRQVDCRKQYAAILNAISHVPEAEDSLADDCAVARVIQRFVRGHCFLSLRGAKRRADGTRVRVAIRIGGRTHWVVFPREIPPRRRRQWVGEQRVPHNVTTLEVQQLIDRDFHQARVLSLAEALDAQDSDWLGSAVPLYAANQGLKSVGIKEAVANEKARSPEELPEALSMLSPQERYDLVYVAMEQRSEGRLCFASLPFTTGVSKSTLSRAVGRSRRGKPSALDRNLARVIAGNADFRAMAKEMGLLEAVERVRTASGALKPSSNRRWMSRLLAALRAGSPVNWEQALSELICALRDETQAGDCAAFLSAAIGFAQDIAGLRNDTIDPELAWDLVVAHCLSNDGSLPRLSPTSRLGPVVEIAQQITTESAAVEGEPPQPRLQLRRDGVAQREFELTDKPQILRVVAAAGHWCLSTSNGRVLWSEDVTPSQLQLSTAGDAGDSLELAASAAAKPVEAAAIKPDHGVRVVVLPGLQGGMLRIELPPYQGGLHA